LLKAVLLLDFFIHTFTFTRVTHSIAWYLLQQRGWLAVTGRYCV